MATLIDRNSKADTRALLMREGGGSADLKVDQSQWRTDLTDHTTYLTSSDTRLAVRSPREISVVLDLSTSSDGIVLQWGNVAGSTWIYQILMDSGSPRFGHNSDTIGSITPPNINGTAKSYLLHWSTDYDVADATWYSEVAICDLLANAWEIARFDHDEPDAPAGGDQFNLLGYGAGVSKFNGGISAIDFVRVGCRFHSTCEAKEDWVDESSPPSVDGVQLPVELAPASTIYYTANPVDDLSDAILDAGTFAGPAEFAATINAAASRKRLIGPLLNEEMNAPPIYQDTFLPANFHRPVSLGGTNDLQLTVSHIYLRFIPYGVTRARVWVHAQTYIAAGAPMGTTVENYLQVGSCGVFPPIAAVIKPPGSFTAQFLSTTDHGSSGVGEWFDLGDMPIQQDPVHQTSFVLAYGFGAGTGHTYLRTVVKAIRIEGYEE